MKKVVGEKVVDKILKFHWIKLIILIVLILLFFILSKLFYAPCVYGLGSGVMNSSYIDFSYGNQIKCINTSYSNYNEKAPVLCINEDCKDVTFSHPAFCTYTNVKCKEANSFSSLMNNIALTLFAYLVITIFYSSIKLFVQRSKKKR